MATLATTKKRGGGSSSLDIYLRDINRYPLLMAHLEWIHGQQGKEGRWNLSTKLLNESSRWTAMLRLEPDWRSPVRTEADMTFRMLVILKHQWERQVRMLDRRDDGYPF